MATGECLHEQITAVSRLHAPVIPAVIVICDIRVQKTKSAPALAPGAASRAWAYPFSESGGASQGWAEDHEPGRLTR